MVFKFFFSNLHFYVGFVLDISVIYQYIVDIEQFFPIFPKNDFRLQKSCRDGSTPEISNIYRRYFAIFSSMTISTTIDGTILLMHDGVSKMSYRIGSTKGYSSSLT